MAVCCQLSVTINFSLGFEVAISTNENAILLMSLCAIWKIFMVIVLFVEESVAVFGRHGKMMFTTFSIQ